MNIFGFEIKRSTQERQDTTPSFAPEIKDDGAVVVAAGGAYGTYIDLEGSVRTEAELITKYREMALHPEVDSALEDIVNEAIVRPEKKQNVIDLNLDNVTGVSENIKNKIKDEYANIVKLLNLNNIAHDIFKRWYIDGRLYYHAIIDVKNTREGIQELRYLDPRKIRKVREITRTKDRQTPSPITKTVTEYFIYNERGFNNRGVAATSQVSTEGIKITKDSIIHATSGLMNQNSTMVLSYLHKAIKPLNQLRTLEDATVIYRLSRAPERRIFYIDVGNLPKMKAEQYLRDMMTRHKNKIVYDSTTGEIRDDRKFMTMLEDYWLPRREGGKGTEITTLPAGQNLGQIDDVKYFQKNLYKSLNVPISRMDEEALYSLGRATEITRDEIKFAKFIQRIRTKFCDGLLSSCLEKQLVLKAVMTQEEWNNIVQDIKYEFSSDNLYSELKELEILKEKIGLIAMADPFAGKYYSIEWVRSHILGHDQDEQEEEQEKISQEGGMGLYDPPGMPNEDPTQAIPGTNPPAAQQQKKPIKKPAPKKG